MTHTTHHTTAHGILLEARHPDRNVEPYPGRAMSQRKDKCRRHDLLHTREQRLERRRLQRLHEPQGGIDLRLDHEIDVDRHPRLA